ncbi:MAG: VOC family protein [Dehalococcoidia bacterium]|nr:VOC family protein [Dehalococcoidia bacterium]
MAVYSYDHIHLRSPDPATAAKFYNKMFDAQIIETPQPDGNTRVDLNLNGLTIFLAGAMPSGTEVQGVEGPHYGLDHFGLRVDNLDSAVSDLKAKGAELESEPRTLPTGVKIAFVKAPDDVRIELVERH